MTSPYYHTRAFRTHMYRELRAASKQQHEPPVYATVGTVLIGAILTLAVLAQLTTIAR